MPVEMVRTIECPYGAKLKLSVKLFWDVSGQLRDDYKKHFMVNGHDYGGNGGGNSSLATSWPTI